MTVPRPEDLTPVSGAEAGPAKPAPAADIAFFLHGFEMGGAQRRTIMLAGELARRGHRIALLVAQDEGPLRAQVHEDVTVIALAGRLGRLPWIRSRRRRRVRAAIPGLVLYLRHHRPCVLIAAANHSLLAALWAHKLARCPDVRLVLRVSTVLSGPGLSRRLRAFAVRRSVNRADAVVAVSEAVARDAQQMLPALVPPVRVLPSPVIPPDLPRRIAAPAAHRWFSDDGPPVILGVGRLVPQKDFPTLLRAFALLRHQRAARLVILGDGPERRRLEALADELDLAPSVALPGAVDDPLPFMARAAVFVLSSVWEGMPGALIEAMACGCAVVSTDCPGGSAEILEHGRLGPLVPPRDTAALALAMRHALDRPPPRDHLRARAMHYSVRAAADATLDLLRGL